MDPRDEAAADYDLIARELDRAAAHARVAARHLRNRDVPSSGAHTVALLGHLERTRELLAVRTKTAADFARLPGDDAARGV